MATIKGVLADFETRGGDCGKDAVLAVRQYAELDTTDKIDLARYARAVARMLNQMAVELDREPGIVANEGPVGFPCPVGDGTIAVDSHQADPCIHCSKVYHDRCFYAKGHPCVRAGLIEERVGYGVKKAV